MNRIGNENCRRGLTALIGSLLLLPLTVWAAEGKDFNLLLITLDTVRADCIGAAGNRDLRTPNIDALCRGGVFFRRAYAPVPLTLPSHTSVMTGRYPPVHRVRVNGRHRLDDEEETLAEILGRQGYATHAVIASYVLQSRFGIGQGFIGYDDGLTLNDHTDQASAEIPADRVYMKFKRWLGGSRGQKFFAWVHFYDPHRPYRPPPAFVRKGFEKDIRKLYLGEIEHVDLYVGQMVKDLRERGLLRNTLIVLAGDHGEAFGEHQEYGHMVFAYEENLRVPLLFYNSFLMDSRVVDEPVCLVDILPTVLDLFGIPARTAVQGRSLRPFFVGEKPWSDRLIYFESLWGSLERNWAPLRGILFRGMKFIDLPDAELYDLGDDPEEKMNLLGRKSRLAAEYREKLQAFQSLHPEKQPVQVVPNRAGLRKLASLGYISGPGARIPGGIDPKRGILLKNKLDRLSELVARGEGYEETKRELRELMRKAPDLKSPELYDLLFRVHFAESDRPAALRLSAEGVEAFPASAPLRMNLAMLLMQNQDYSGAEAQCQRILKIDPGFLTAYLTLSEISQRRGRISQAVDYCRLALRVEPENQGLRDRLDRLLKLLTRQKKISPEDGRH